MSNSLFGSSEGDDEGQKSNDTAVAKLILFVVLLPFIPAVILGLFFYWLFLRVLKLKRSVSGVIALGFAGASYLALTALDGINRAMGAFTASGGIVENWAELLYLLAPLSVGLGALFGYGLILWDVRDIYNNPHRVELPGFWTYKIQWRKTPLELLRKRRALKALRSGTLIDDRRAPLGYEEKEDRVGYRFTEESVRHTLVTGAAGSGKTISMLSMMRADIESGRTVIAIDFKRSPEFAAKLASWSHEFSIPFYHFEKGKPESYRTEFSQGQSTYDPFASGSGSEMVLNLREYDTNSAVYKEAMQQLLQVLFAMMEQADRSKAPNVDWNHGGIYQLASAITDPNLKDLLVACEGKPIFHDAQDYVPLATSGKGPEKDTLEKLRGQMRTMVASGYGRWFKIGDGSRNIDLLKMMTGEQTIVLFSFNSDEEEELSRYVGSMIFADLNACSSQIRNRKASKVTNIYVDEFQAVPPTAVTALLEKSRESKFAMTLAQQAFEQIITSSKSNGEAYLQSILVTCSNFLTHAGMTQDSAERISKLMGKHWKAVYSRTNKSDGGFFKNNFGNRRNQIISATNQEIWKVEPSEFMELSAPSSVNGYRSTAILINKAVADPDVEAEGTIARKLWMVPPQVVLDEYVTPFIGDEVDPNAQNLYVDSSVSLLTAEEQKAQDDNTPVYREDSEILGDSYGRIYGGNNQPKSPEDELKSLISDESFESFGADYDQDEDNDGDFDIEEIIPEEINPRAALTEDLAAFDSAPPLRNLAAKTERPSTRRPPAVRPEPKVQEESLPEVELPRLGRSAPRRTPAQRPQPAADSYEEESLPEI